MAMFYKEMLCCINDTHAFAACAEYVTGYDSFYIVEYILNSSA